MRWRVVVGGLADSAGFRSVHSQRWAGGNAPDRMLWMPRIVLAFIGWQTCGRHPADGSRGRDQAASLAETRCLSQLTWEPVIGFEPMACRLQEVRPRAPYVLAAQITRVIALTALAALGFSDTPFHEPFHGRNAWTVLSRYFCNFAEGAALTPTTGPGRRGSETRNKFRLARMVIVGDRGMISAVRINAGKFKLQPTIYDGSKWQQLTAIDSGA